MFPRHNELHCLPEILGLVTLAVRHAKRRAVRDFGPCPSLTGAFRPGVLSFVKPRVRSLWAATRTCLRGFALNLECSMQRLLCIDANYFMSCTSVANFPEKRCKVERPWPHVQSTNSQVFDFHIWSSLSFLMQWRQTRQDSFQRIARPNSSWFSILLCFSPESSCVLFNITSEHLVELKL